MRAIPAGRGALWIITFFELRRLSLFLIAINTQYERDLRSSQLDRSGVSGY
jgi:hypothetical protein